MTDRKSVGAALRVDLLKADRRAVSKLRSESLTCASRQQITLLARRLGARLTELVAASEFQTAAAKIQELLSESLNAIDQGICPVDIPEFLDAGLGEPPQFDPVVFANQINAPHAGNALAADDSVVARNLSWLEMLLGLTPAERKLLVWSYCLQQDVSGVLPSVSAQIRCAGWADAIVALSILLDESTAAIGDSLFQSCRLRAMGLLDIDLQHEPSSMAECMIGSQTLVDILETPYRSEAALLVDLVDASPSWQTLCEMLVSDATLLDWFGGSVAELLSTAMAGKALSASHISTAIGWLTGWYVPVPHCEPLSRHIDLAGIDRAVRQCFVAHARRKSATTPLALMQALYAAAGAM